MILLPFAVLLKIVYTSRGRNVRDNEFSPRPDSAQVFKEQETPH